MNVVGAQVTTLWTSFVNFVGVYSPLSLARIQTEAILPNDDIRFINMLLDTGGHDALYSGAVAFAAKMVTAGYIVACHTKGPVDQRLCVIRSKLRDIPSLQRHPDRGTREEYVLLPASCIRCGCDKRCPPHADKGFLHCTGIGKQGKGKRDKASIVSDDNSNIANRGQNSDGERREHETGGKHLPLTGSRGVGGKEEKEGIEQSLEKRIAETAI